jgi:hypothetical protein
LKSWHDLGSHKRMWRLLALSSTTSARRPRSKTGGGLGAWAVEYGPPEPRREGEVLPRPCSLCTLIPPPIRAARRAAIDSPRQVPPYLRVVELSSCSNARKILSCLSGGMPIPVSVTLNRSPTSPTAARLPGGNAFLRRREACACWPRKSSPRSLRWGFVMTPSREHSHELRRARN